MRLCSSILTLLLLGAEANAADLLAGAATVDITPPIGYRMAGYFNERLSTGTHDPLMAKALVFNQGDRQVAVVVCDLIGIHVDVTRDARRRIAKETKIPEECVMITATHSHTAPLYSSVLRTYFHERAVSKLGSDPAETVNYADELAGKIALAAVSAHQQMKPATLATGAAEQTGLSFNRRFHMKDGKVQTNPGKKNPNIIRPAGPIDLEVGLLLVHGTERDKPVALLSVFALHLDTVGGTEYSADYPSYLAQRLKAEYGDEFVSIFGTGTCGDINHVDVTTDKPQKGHEEARRIGDALADTVLPALAKLEPVKEPSLGIASKTVEIEMPEYTNERAEQAQRDLAKIGTREMPFLEQVETCKILSVKKRGGDKLPLEVQVIRLANDAAIVGLPGEVFVELGLAIKQKSPFARTLVIELANDNPAYIPTRKAFAEGSYETVNSIITPGGGEQLAETALELLEQLKQAK